MGYLYVYIYIYTHTHTHTHIYTHTYIHVCVCMRVHACVCLYTHIHIYLYACVLYIYKNLFLFPIVVVSISIIILSLSNRATLKHTDTKKMEKNERVLRKRHSHNRLSGGNIMPRRELRSSHRIHSNILQDESLPSMRSLHSKSLLERKKRVRECVCVCVCVWGGGREERSVLFNNTVSYRNHISLMAGKWTIIMEQWWNDTYRSTLRTNCCSANLSTTDPTWTGLWSNQGFSSYAGRRW